jgi:ABC-type nitrate/sulfonate/bicarbonate transport system permease component
MSGRSFWRRELSVPVGMLVSAGAVIAFIALWWLITLPGGAISPLYLPPPQDVAATFFRMRADPYLGSTLLAHIGASLSVVMSGWLLAGLVGLPLGIAIGWWKRIRWIVFPVFQLVRPVPPLAWIPLAIIWLGIGDAARIFVVFIAALVPWVMNSMHAVNSVEPLLVAAARTLGASDAQILTKVICRTALPTLVAGARISLGNAWTTLVAAELLAASSGLGYVALNASRTLETDVLLVAMGIIGLLGALFSLGMRAATRVVAPWAGKGTSHD